MTLLGCQSSGIVIVLSQPANHVRLRMTVPAPSSYLRSYKIIFYLKFLILTVEIGQNRNEIGNIKIITNLLTEYYLHLNGYLERKLS